MATQAQIQANQANAQLSTGPRTEEGKAKVSLNAVRSGLTGATVLLPTDDAALYEKHVSDTRAAWKPANHREEVLVQLITDIQWRLMRVASIESGIIALARRRLTNLFEDEPEHIRLSMIDAQIDETCARQLHNLHLQENRLARRLEKAVAELKQLQSERIKERERQLEAAAAMYERFKHEDWEEFIPFKFGFEFTIQEVEERVAYHEALQVRCPYPKQYAKYFGAPRLKDERLEKAA